MSMADRDGVIWYDGELVQWRDATTHVLTHTLHYGMGVFEGVRAYDTPQGTAIFRLQAHTDRLFDSAHIMNMQIPYSRDEINEATRAAVRENNLESAYIRPMVFYGSEGMGLRASGLKVHVIIAAWSWGAYINSMLALQEAISGGADEAMMLDPEGYVAEGSGENIFIIKDGVIYTPEVTACLNGITRNTILTLAAEHGFKLVEKRITRDEVYIADEAFFTGTAAEVTPIREVDGRKIGAGRRGPVTEKLQKAYFDLVSGKTEAHAEWRTLVK